MNRLLLHAQLVQRSATRYTPAGLPALDLSLKHESTVDQEGQPRKLSFEMRALAVGEVARGLNGVALGAAVDLAGFIAQGRNGRGWVFHVTEFSVPAAAPDTVPA
ncbi:MAG: primosomal replication protein N [Rubrivivax sp.]|jgi:primosomal replication protein N|nr:primosomal replication protein N [Rubrivivax sp.]